MFTSFTHSQKQTRSATILVALLAVTTLIAACGPSSEPTATPAPATIAASSPATAEATIATTTETTSTNAAGPAGPAAGGNVLTPTTSTGTSAVTETGTVTGVETGTMTETAGISGTAAGPNAQGAVTGTTAMTTSATGASSGPTATVEISPSTTVTAVTETLPAPTATETSTAISGSAAATSTTGAASSPATTTQISPSATVTAVIETLPAPKGVMTSVVTATVFDLSKSSVSPAGLARRVVKTVRPAVANMPDQPPTANGLPTRVQFSFDNDQISTTFDPRQRQVLILPVAEYRALFANDANALSFFDTRLDTLKKLLATKPATMTVEIPMFPPLGAAQVIAAQVKYLNFAGGSCVRFVTAYAQDVSPVTSDRLFYTCQGLTSDGKNLVSFVYPVSSSVTPASYRRVRTAVLAELNKNPQGYFLRITRELNVLAPRGFRPALEGLDSMVQSFSVNP